MNDIVQKGGGGRVKLIFLTHLKNGEFVKKEGVSRAHAIIL